jgi:serine/threonine-protein kinase RsbT
MKKAPRASAAADVESAARRPVLLGNETRVPINSDLDILTARQQGRALAQGLGLSNSNLTLIATAISELARNILLYARRGELVLGIVREDTREGVAVVARDEGPGIADLDRAMEVGYSTSGSLGLGLPGVRRLMDDFEIVSEVGKGTTVTARKWKR